MDYLERNSLAEVKRLYAALSPEGQVLFREWAQRKWQVELDIASAEQMRWEAQHAD